jgi:hypothetical protein
MNAGQAADAYPNACVALSELSLMQRAIRFGQDRVLDLLRGRLPPGFQLTMGKEDRRRPRMERGLAVWTDQAQRFYPLAALQARGNALIDAGLAQTADQAGPALDGKRALVDRRFLVFVDPTSGIPTCLYTEAQECNWQEGALVLDTGEYVRGPAFRDELGETLPGERPMQSTTCWYIYAFTFPGGAIYGARS